MEDFEIARLAAVEVEVEVEEAEAEEDDGFSIGG